MFLYDQKAAVSITELPRKSLSRTARPRLQSHHSANCSSAYRSWCVGTFREAGRKCGRGVEVEQIRAFLGALLLGGFAHGVFVYASGFQRGAVQAARACQPWAAIELVDAERFFDALCIAQLQGEVDPEECGFYGERKPPVFLHSAFHLNSI